MRVGGLDPSLNATGLAILTVTPGPVFVLRTSRTLQMPAKHARAAKLCAIAAQVVAATPEAEVWIMETPFQGKYASAVMALSEVRGAILSHLYRHSLPTPHDLDPRKVKQVLTGKGNATKEQVALAVQRRLGMDQPLLENEADACAVAMAWVLLHPELCET